MTEWALIALTKEGLQTCQRLQKALELPCDILTIEKRKTQFTTQLFAKFADLMAYAFTHYRVMVCVMASGIVVRALTPLLVSKQSDPAVLVMDQKGHYCISLLSGHIGQANQYAHYVAEKSGAEAIITTASDNLGKAAVDTLAQRHNYAIADFDSAKEITAMILNNLAVMITAQLADLPENVTFDTLEHQKQYDGAIVVSSRNDIAMEIPFVQLIPKNIVVGIGCRRGTEQQVILNAIQEMMTNCDFNEKAIQKLATVDIKQDEKGILDTARTLQVPVQIIDREAIKPIEDQFTCSDFVRKTIGVGCVAEPCGFLASKGGRKICGKTILNGITISLWEEDLG